MERSTCVLCNKNKTALRCVSCGDVSCKKCVQFIDEDHFEMISLLPEDLKNKTFCMNCYHQGVAERISHYSEVAEEAKKVDIFSKTQSKETRRIKRIEDPIQVADCEDKELALMRLAFLSVEKGYSTIVDVEVKAKKSGEAKRYKKVVWTASGIPVDPGIKK